MNFPLSSPRQVEKRYALGVLNLLSEASARGDVDASVLRASVDAFYAAIRVEMDSCLTALYTMDDNAVKHAATRVAERLSECVRSSHPPELDASIPNIIGGNDRLAIALARTPEAAPIQVAVEAWKGATQLLSDSGHIGGRIVDDCALAVLGLQGSFGHIKAFSDANLPGFVAFSVDNPPGVVAEQLLHESVHTLLWSYLQLNPNAADALSACYGAYSTFAKRGRSAIRILHGALSYGAVCSLWLTIRDTGLAGRAFATPDAQGVLLVGQRIKTLRRRVETSLCALRNVCSNGEVAALALATNLTWCFDSVRFDSVGKGSLAEQIRVVRAAGLDDISQAEILLAVVGTKQSRTVLANDELAFLDAFARAGGKYIIGRRLVKSLSDELCAGFSNVVSSSFPLDSEERGLDAYVYFGTDLHVIAETARLDEVNGAGELLGIPDCCQRFFSLNWDEVRRRGGDLFGHLLAQQPQVITGYEECNAAAMYRGKGLCWHFPCSLNCEKTRHLIATRAKRLWEVDSDLCKRLMHGAEGVLIWSSTSGYSFLEAIELDGTIPSSAQWLHGAGFTSLKGAECSLRSWVLHASATELRRAVRFG